MAKNSKFNFWPIGITIFFFYVLAMIIWTVISAVTTPVQDENMFMNNYQYVDEHYNDLLKIEKWFDDNYRLTLNNKEIKIGQNRLKINLSKNSGEDVKNVKIVSLITRAETNNNNIDIGELFLDKNSFISKPFLLEKEGRWIVLLKITIDNKIVYKKLDITIG